MASLSERSNQKRAEVTQKKIKKAKHITSIVVIISAIICIIFYVFFEMNRTYGAVSVVNSINRADSSSVQYLEYNGNILKYSKDGASALSLDGEILWNGSYDFKNPMAVTCGNYVAIADIGGKEIYIFNGNDTGTKLEVEAAVEQISVANQGVVAAILENDDEAQINIYDPYSTTEQLKVSISTSTDSDGYPVAIALSEDGKKLVTSYINISSGVLESSVNFYNFDEVGKNSVDRIVGSRPLDREIVSNIEFINKTTICAYTETGFKLYTMKQTPQDIAEVTMTKTIKSICHNKQYITFVLEDVENMEYPYLIQVYNTAGKLVLEKNVDCDYEKIEMGQKEILLYSKRESEIIRINGIEKLICDFDAEIEYFFPISGSDKYILIDKEKINEIKLIGNSQGE